MRPLTCISLVFLALAKVAVAGTPLPVYQVAYVPAEPTVDGRLDDPAWAAAPWSGEFGWVDAGDPAPVGSRFRAVYGVRGLHFAFVFTGEAIPAGPLDPDLPRACEVFLDPEGQGRTYLEYAVSPEGVEHAVTWHGRLSMQAWEGRIGVASRSAVARELLPDGQETVTYEVSFPWEGLRSLAPGLPCPPRRGEAWPANFSRVEAGTHAGDYTWAPCGFYYLHTPNTFGWLVFRGEDNGLTEVPALTPLLDDSERISGEPRFRLLSRLWWARFPVLPAGGGDLWAVTKCSVTRFAPDGAERFARTRRDGLPQFIRSLAATDGGLYVAGNGLALGLALVTPEGRVSRPGAPEGYELAGVAQVHDLGGHACAVSAGERLQVMRGGRFAAPVEGEGRVVCACALRDGSLAVGTERGVEVWNAAGGLLRRTAVAGGIAKLTPVAGAAIGVSGKNGLFSVNSEGECAYFPYPLRTKFDGAWLDSLGRVWAGYTGGVVLIEGRRVKTFAEPRGVGGFRVTGAAALGGGGMAFLCTLPGDPWYRSSGQSPFLLLFRQGKWERITVAEGLPGEVSAIARVQGRVLLSSSAGVFGWRG